MTPEEAKNRILGVHELGVDCDLLSKDEYKFHEVLLNALEKQITKKPVIVGEDYIFEKDEWEKDYECPTCGNPYADDSYCSCCGQRLDWS